MSLSVPDACSTKCPCTDHRDTTSSGRISGPSDLHSAAPDAPQAAETKTVPADAHDHPGKAFGGTACGARSTRCTGVR